MKHPYDLFKENVDRHPGEIIMGDAKGVLTGKEALDLIDRYTCLIDERLGQHERNVGIAILLPRDARYLAAMFAVWKAGHYFIPLNDRWPREHLNLILNKSKPRLVLSMSDINGFEVALIKDAPSKQVNLGGEKRRWENRRKEARLAYTIFTSGSTGDQKGVMIPHAAYDAYIEWVRRYFKDHAGNKALLITAELTFDITLGDIAFALAHDVQVHVSPDPRQLIWHAKLIMDRKIDTFYSVPSTINHLFSWVHTRQEVSFKDLKLVVSGGDAFALDLIELVKEVSPGAEFHNVYGPTEVTINCAATRVDNLKNRIRKHKNLVPIGMPFQHLDTKLISDPIAGIESGTIGELIVAGEQCMDGYIHEPQLTKDAFLEIKGKKYYRTGDLVERDEDGYHYVIGRIDNLVKVKGYRINPVEIDNIISEDQRVAAVKTVTFHENESDKLIVSFIVIQEKGADIPNDILNRCRARLPDYMVPGDIFLVKNIPIGSSGKYDTNALKAMYLKSLQVSEKLEGVHNGQQ